MKQTHYMDIERLKDKNASGFEKGDFIVVQEKIDGANFSFRYDEETDTIRAFSRKTELNLNNNLRGAWEWSQLLDKNLVKSILGSRYIVFAEWLVKHTVPYPDNKYNNAYCFDVYDTETEQYLHQYAVSEIIAELGLIYVPAFYVGQFTSWEDLIPLVGRTKMGGEYGEGIVVKNMTKLNNPNTRTPFYTKIVAEKFCETKGHKDSKPVDPTKLIEREKKIELVETVVTEARVRKLLHKMVDENIISEDWDEHNMSTIAKNIGKAVYYDCVKEEPDVIQQVGTNFGKLAASVAMKITRNILSNKI